MTYAYAEKAHGAWCDDHRPVRIVLALSMAGVEALRWLLPATEVFPFDVEAAIACVEGDGMCAAAFGRDW